MMTWLDALLIESLSQPELMAVRSSARPAGIVTSVGQLVYAGSAVCLTGDDLLVH